MLGDDKAFDVEHALNMYAIDHVIVPAAAIYDDEALKGFWEVIRKCHIYMIGLTPKVDFEGASQSGRTLVCHMRILGKACDVEFPLPEGTNLKIEESNGQKYWRVEDPAGNRSFPSELLMQTKLHYKTSLFSFDVQYIGQAYGKKGSRNALVRLKKHETLQEISLRGIPEGYNLTILMLAIVPANRTMTIFNPRAKDRSAGDERIKMGLEKLFGTTEEERITLYEASLIRYFEPRYNIEFKNSFPSTNLKVLRDCYAKDFSAVIAEINFDDLPFGFKSGKVALMPSIIATHHLHKAKDREVFFGGSL